MPKLLVVEDEIAGLVAADDERLGAYLEAGLVGVAPLDGDGPAANFKPAPGDDCSIHGHRCRWSGAR